MTPYQILEALKDLGVTLTIREGRLFCRASRAKVPPELQEALSEHREEILIQVRKNLKRERLAWVMTSDGPAKVWGFLDDRRVGVILKRDLAAKDGRRVQVRFIDTTDLRQVQDDDDLSRWHEPSPLPQEETVEEWLVESEEIEGKVWVFVVRFDCKAFKIWRADSNEAVK